jgi:hypothetical protein
MAYPEALPLSGILSIRTIREWMIAAGEIAPTTNISLSTLVSSSHLIDKSAPYRISDFYGYSINVHPPFDYPWYGVTILAGVNTCIAQTGGIYDITTDREVLGIGTIVRFVTSGEDIIINWLGIVKIDNYKCVLETTTAYVSSRTIKFYAIKSLVSCTEELEIACIMFNDGINVYMEIWTPSSKNVTSTIDMIFLFQGSDSGNSIYAPALIYAGTNLSSAVLMFDSMASGFWYVEEITVQLVFYTPNSDATYEYVVEILT